MAPAAGMDGGRPAVPVGSLRRWLALTRPGDRAMLALALLLPPLLAHWAWQGGAADTVVVRSRGQVFAELPLARDRTLTVPGPLGDSLVRVQDRRARVAADPSPRQYCVRQGWLAQAGEVAVCLPNQVSIEVRGSRSAYDSLAY